MTVSALTLRPLVPPTTTARERNTVSAKKPAVQILRRKSDPPPLYAEQEGLFTRIQLFLQTFRFTSADIKQFRLDLARSQEKIGAEMAAAERRHAEQMASLEMRCAVLEAEKTELMSTVAKHIKVISDKETMVRSMKDRTRFAEYAKAEAVVIKEAEMESVQHQQTMKVVGRIMHDLGSPHMALQMTFEMLKQMSPTEKALPCIAKGANLVRDLEAMKENALINVKLVHGAIMIKKQPLDIAKQLREIMEIQSMKADKNGKCIVLTCDETVMINGDRLNLGRVFNNILDNARRDSKKNIGVVVEKAGQNVVIRICDDGHGVPKEIQEKIFMQFSTNVVHGGNGFGLTNSKQIAELHGGSVKVESEEGKGSTFIVTLPVE